MPSKYFEIAGYAVNVFHAPPTTLPGVPPALSRGTRLVFLHGAGSTGAVWQRQLRYFAARHSPIAFDWPGHGRSSGTEALPSIEAYADSTIAILDRLGIASAVLVATSMGGLVALELALRAPQRVLALVLMSTAARIALSDESVEIWRTVMTGRASQPFSTAGYGDGVPSDVVREGWALQVQTDPRVRYFDLVAARRADFRARLGELRLPVLVIYGSKDTITPPGDAAALAAGISGAERVELAGAGHYLYRERPDALHAAIDAFLERLP
ncbi:MAG TPA: alpha/beta fold hydrolase [Candidatus Binatia bacterium]|nr:alpha/beta fold hydrolase [Candidatus Binatia bacterium]